MVGGNTTASVVRIPKTKDARGVAVSGQPVTLMQLAGWLDYQSGQASHLPNNAKLLDTTHVFVSDYDSSYAALDVQNLFLSIGGDRYEVLLIDDPMGMHAHIETYLKYLGA